MTERYLDALLDRRRHTAGCTELSASVSARTGKWAAGGWSEASLIMSG